MCIRDSSLYSIRSVVICLLAFVAFLRFDELAKLVRFDVKIVEDGYVQDSTSSRLSVSKALGI